ncbi:hypothetical protein DV736_g1998, partial [Chaetothyriales sp. CBS 134916]
MDLYTFLLSLFWGEIFLYLLLGNFFLPSPEALRHLGGLVRELAQNTFEFAFNGLCSAVHRIVLGLVNFSFDLKQLRSEVDLAGKVSWLRAVAPSREGDDSDVADARPVPTRITARGRQSINSNYTARPTRLTRKIRQRQARALIDSLTARHVTPEQEAEPPAQRDDDLAVAKTPVVAQQPQEQSEQAKEEEVVAKPAAVVSQPLVWRQPPEDSPSDDDEEEQVAGSTATAVVVDSPVVSATLSACEGGGEPPLLAKLSEAFRAMEVTPWIGDMTGSEPASPAAPEPVTEQLWLPSTPSLPSLPSLPSVPSLPSLSEAVADEPPQHEQLLGEEPEDTLPNGPYSELWSQLDKEFGGAETSVELDALPAMPFLPRTIETSIPGLGEALPEDDAAAPAAGVVAPAMAAAALNNNTSVPPASSFWDNTSQMFGRPNAVVEGLAASTAPPPPDGDVRLSYSLFSPPQAIGDDAFGDAEAEALLGPLILEVERLRRLQEGGGLPSFGDEMSRSREVAGGMEMAGFG